jgi:predicted nicotinamide N-methyase
MLRHGGAFRGATKAPRRRIVPGYEVSTSTHRVGSRVYSIRALADRLQYSDPDELAARAGISKAAWPTFGVLWPAGIALAQEMNHIPIAGKRILEVGCGIGLSSLVLRMRGADITACDHHPLAGEFLRHNAKLNGLAPIAFHLAPWGGRNSRLGRFDLIIGADLLYERDHPSLLSGFMSRHATAAGCVIIADPGRGYRGRFSSQMRAQGYSFSDRRVRLDGAGPPAPDRGRLTNYDRSVVMNEESAWPGRATR